jgi:hypothetical protein
MPEDHEVYRINPVYVDNVFRVQRGMGELLYTVSDPEDSTLHSKRMGNFMSNIITTCVPNHTPSQTQWVTAALSPGVKLTVT